MDQEERIARYRTAAADLRDALSGITEDELDRAQPDGEWTARQITHHLADSEAMAYTRLRRADRGRARRHPGLRRARMGAPAPLRATHRRLRRRGRGRARCEPGAAPRPHARRVGANRHPLGVWRVLRPTLARDLRRPYPRSRRPDPAGAIRPRLRLPAVELPLPPVSRQRVSWVRLVKRRRRPSSPGSGA